MSKKFNGFGGAIGFNFGRGAAGFVGVAAGLLGADTGLFGAAAGLATGRFVWLDAGRDDLPVPPLPFGVA